MAASWGYKEENGPKNWGKWFPVAESGTRQSPIDICVADCEDGGSLPAVVAKYDALSDLTIENTGASWKLNWIPEKSSLSGGPLKDEFKLEQMHAHWGKEEGRGAEHTFDGKVYDGELHLVHWNTKYGSFGEAVDKGDGLAVIGIFLQVGETANEEFAKITDVLSAIKKKGDKSQVSAKIDPSTLIKPGGDSYFTYEGSLTTPPLFESVTFLLYDKPMTISKEQIAQMRSLLVGLEDNCDCVVDNFRPVCPKNNRKVKKAKNNV